MAATSSVYANAGTWSASNIITGVTMRNSLNNIHPIDANSVVAVNTTNTQIYTDDGSGTYISQETYSDSADVIGYGKEFILNNNLYIYNTTEPTSETRWSAGSNTKYSTSLGSLGSFTNNTFSNQIGSIDALNEIRTAILGLSVNNLSVSLPKYVSDINPDSGTINFEGYEIIVNTGTATNETTSFSINDAGADGTNITANYEYETDGTGTAAATNITLTEPYGTETLTLNVSADNSGDDQADQIGTDLIGLINNNVESPNDYTATYDTTNKKITFTSVSAINSNASKLWTATVNNGSVTAPDVGDIVFGTSSITTTGVLGETYLISAPNLNTTTMGGNPLFSQVTFTGGTTQIFANNLNATNAAVEFKDALNASLNGFMTATIDSGDSKIVNYTTTIQDNIGLDFTFSDSNITKSITQGILGTTQTNINDAGKTNVLLYKPGSSTADLNKSYVGFNPTLSGAINSISDIISNINTATTDWVIEKDQPGSGQIRFTSVDSAYFNNIFRLVITNNTATGTTAGNFSTGSGNASITTLGSSTPSYYGLRSVILANKDVFSNTTTDYSWFETTTNSLGTILPSYKVPALKTPEFKFDGESGGSAAIADEFLAIPANSSGQYVIDTDLITLSEISNIPVDQSNNTINGSEMVYYSTKLYIAYRVNNDSEITGLSLGSTNSGATIYTNPGTTYSITDSNGDALIAAYIYKWNGTAWVKET